MQLLAVGQLCVTPYWTNKRSCNGEILLCSLTLRSCFQEGEKMSEEHKATQQAQSTAVGKK